MSTCLALGISVFARSRDKTKKLMTVLVFLGVAVPGAGAWGTSIPVTNGSFELTYPPGSTGLNYWSGPTQYLKCPLDGNAKDGSRVLTIDLAGIDYTYAFGPVGDAGIDETIKPGWSYTVSVWAKKAAGHSNAGGWIYAEVGPSKGTFGDWRVQFDIPPLTEDEVWKQYSVVLDAAAHTEYVGRYISLIALGGWGKDETTQMVFDHVTIEGTATASIGGTVTLGNWNPADPDKRLTPVKIEMIPQGNGVAKTEVVVLDANDRYHFECYPGTYNVAFTTARWLRKVVPGVVVSYGPETRVDAVLTNGDVSGNNHVGTPDFSILSGNFGQRGQRHNTVRGKQWVRSHPFTVSALVANCGDMALPPAWNLQQYLACNFTASTPWNFDNSHPWRGGTPTPQEAQFLADMDANGMPWHWRLNITSLPSNPDNTLTAPDKDNGWLITDEPAESDLPGIAQAANWLRQNRPNSLVYINLGSDLYGNDISLNNVMHTVQPDVLMYDWYGFMSDGTTRTDTYFQYLTALRKKANQYGVPLWSWMQAIATTSGLRLPGESDVRMQVFSSLAAGCKGIMYFLYDNVYGTQPPHNFAGAIIQYDGTRSSLYYDVQYLNPEVSSLGRVLRYLESTDLRFIPGRTGGSPNAPWSGLSNWTAGAGEDSRIVSVEVDPSEDGPEKNGLIGFSTDDTGQQYFMLANLYHGALLTASAASLGFTITFDSSVNGLWRLNRESGAQEWAALTNHSLNTTLPGGTGDLYTYSPAGFDVSPPQGSVSINSGAASTSSQLVSLTLSATDDRGVTHMRFSNDNLAWSDWEPYASSKQWTLPPGEGGKTVYAQYRDAVGTISTTCSDSIALSGE